MKGRILLLGGSGRVGTALARRLNHVTRPTRREFDLATATADDVRHLLDNNRPDALINCAAYTAVDRAEDEADLAHLVNANALGMLAVTAAEYGLPLVTYSTDYVFDGTARRPYLESSHTSPINVYGRSKLAGERLALELNPTTLVIRTSWVISETHPSFVATMLRSAWEGRLIKVVDDQQGSPTIADDLAAATIEAMNLGAGGILHLTNQGGTTWFGLAKAALIAAGLDPSCVRPCSTAEYPTRARRPAYSVLESTKIVDLGMKPLPHWRDSLTGMVGRLMEGFEAHR